MLLFGFLSLSPPLPPPPPPPESQNEPHPFHVKSDWKPPVQPSVALETFLEEVKLELASIEFDKPEDNIYLRESAKLSKSYRATKALFLRNLIKVTPRY